jgi:hypothetical protein
MGYGQRAMKLLQEYYEGKIVNLDEKDETRNGRKLDDAETNNVDDDVNY